MTIAAIPTNAVNFLRSIRISGRIHEKKTRSDGDCVFYLYFVYLYFRSILVYISIRSCISKSETIVLNWKSVGCPLGVVVLDGGGDGLYFGVFWSEGRRIDELTHLMRYRNLKYRENVQVMQQILQYFSSLKLSF